MVALSEKKYNNCIIESILHNSWGCKNTGFAPTAISFHFKGIIYQTMAMGLIFFVIKTQLFG